MPLEPGDKATDFTLLDQNGQPFTLSKSLKQRKAWHLIYFYPQTLTTCHIGGHKDGGRGAFLSNPG